MISLPHLIILFVLILLFFGANRLPRAMKGLGEGVRNFKKGLKGEGDIDVTDSVKRLDDDKDRI